MACNSSYLLAFSRAILKKATDSEPPEVVLRAAISRAYYFAFHYAQDYVIKHYNYTVPQRGDNVSVHTSLRKHIANQTFICHLSNHLEDLAFRRGTADYDFKSDVGVTELRNAVELADYIKEEFDNARIPVLPNS
jgi:hypothetical protein